MTGKIIWSKKSKMNKPLNKMLLRKTHYAADTIKDGIKMAQKQYEKSKHLEVEYNKVKETGRYGFIVRAWY